MSQIPKNNTIAQESSVARERGSSVAREYERVVSTFNKVLEFKEKVRLSLVNRSINITDSLNLNSEKLSTLNRNIDIYDTNISKILNNLDQMISDELVL